MTPGERFKGWIDKLSVVWGATLGHWLGLVIGSGIESFADTVGNKYSLLLSKLVETMEATEEIPPELQPLINELKAPTGEVAAGLTNSVGNLLLGGAMGRITNAIGAPMARAASRMMLPERIGVDLILKLWLRHPEDATKWVRRMEEWGWGGAEAQWLRELIQVRFPSDIVAPAWLRDKKKYGKFWDDVYEVMGLEKKEGVEDERIALLKELAYKIPGVQDIIRYVVKEAYSPEVYKAFGQDQEYPVIAEADAEKTGVRPDQLMKEWIAHWDLPSVGQGFEMLHRGEITPEELTKLLKAKDIMPFWRDKLTDISWSLPGRIEARMMALYGLIDKTKLMELLRKDGLAEEYVPLVADMNIVRGVRTDIQTRYAKKWINKEEVKAEIDKLDLTPPMPDRLYQWIVTNTTGDRTAKEKDLTEATIVKGVKKGIIPWADGVEKLMAGGLDEEEADLRLAVDIEVVEEEATAETTVRTDTIRRQRRQRTISKDAEITALLGLGLASGLATAYADNDDLRLVKAAAVKPPEVKLEYQTDDGKVNVETIRLSRRQRRIMRDEEIMALMELEMSDELAIAYADNDDLRLVKAPAEEA